MKYKLYAIVEGGCLQSVIGDKLPNDVELDIILVDRDNIKLGDTDTLPDDTSNLEPYW